MKKCFVITPYGDGRLLQEAKKCGGVNVLIFNLLDNTNLDDYIIKNNVTHIVAFGDDALNVIFPNRPSGAAVVRIRGAVVQYTINNKLIPVVITYGLSKVIEGYGGNKKIWKADISKVTKVKCITDKVSNPDIILCVEYEQVKECFNKLKVADRVAFDLETTQLRPFSTNAEANPKIYSIAFAFPDNTVYALPLHKHWQSVKSVMDALVKWFTVAREDQIKIAHNMKFDLLWVIKILCKYANTSNQFNKKLLAGNYQDTQLMAWLFDERTTCSRLKICAWKYLWVDNWSIEFSSGRNNGILSKDVNIVLKYNALDSFYTLKLYELFMNKFKHRPNLFSVYNDLMLPASIQFLKIELLGVPINIDKLNDFNVEYKNKIQNMYDKLIDVIGIPNLNPNSPLQLQKYFKEVKKYKLTKRTKTGYSIDNETLVRLSEEYKDVVAKLLLEYRTLRKLHSTYINSLFDFISNGSLHAFFNLTSTVTGRTSSSSPNMQNFPKRANQEIRSVICAPKDYYLVSFDYGQIEARVYAMITGDRNFKEILKNNYDIHYDNSVILFGEKRAAKMRLPVKGGTFAILYGASNKTVGRAVGIKDLSKIELLRKLLFKKFTSFLPWQKKILAYEKKNGFIDSLFGRRRRSPMNYSDILNIIPQSSASDITLYCMNWLGKKYRVAFMIHDDLSFFIKNSKTLDKDIDFIQRCMITLPWCKIGSSPVLKIWVPLSVDCSIGHDWGNLTNLDSLDSHTAGYCNLKQSMCAGNKFIKALSYSGW